MKSSRRILPGIAPAPALMLQWSGGGVSNGVGDFAMIDAIKQP